MPELMRAFFPNSASLPQIMASRRKVATACCAGAFVANAQS